MLRVVIYIFSLLVLLMSSSVAHEVRPSYLELIQETNDSYRVMWKVPAKGNKLHLGLYVNFVAGVENITQPVARFSGGSYISRWRIRHENSLVNTMITIKGLQSTFTEALVRIKRLDGSVQMSRLMPESPFMMVEESPSTVQIISTYTGLGIKHILSGFDHLLFVVCLLFIAGGRRQLVITITGFTVAHSVTLIMSSLNLVNLNIVPVEAIIALSIVFLASEIAKGKRATLTWRYPISVSASFGLLHGFGFAAVLNEIGLPQTEFITGLLFFNLGIEIGQLLFIFAVIVIVNALISLKLEINQKILQKSSAYCIGSLASFWLLERSASFLL